MYFVKPNYFCTFPHFLVTCIGTGRFTLRLYALSLSGIRRSISLALGDAFWKQSSSWIPWSALEVAWFMQHEIRGSYAFLAASKLF